MESFSNDLFVFFAIFLVIILGSWLIRSIYAKPRNEERRRKVTQRDNDIVIPKENEHV